MADVQEQLLLYQIRAFGDERAFDRIYRKYKEPVRRFLSSKLPSPEDADDALSATFIRLWNYLRGAKVDHLSGLIFTIAKGLIAEFYRSRKPQVSLEAIAEEASGVMSDQGQGTGRITASTEIRLVREALDRLPDTDKELILLRHFQGLSFAEIGIELGKKENTVRVALGRATERLKALMAMDEGEEP